MGRVQWSCACLSISVFVSLFVANLKDYKIITFLRLYYINCNFRGLERRQLLDPDSEEDLFCLHHIFLPVIQTFVDEFVGSWNRHGLRTVRGNLSPTRLFTKGLNQLRRRAERNNKQYTELEQVITYNDK